MLRHQVKNLTTLWKTVNTLINKNDPSRQPYI